MRQFDNYAICVHACFAYLRSFNIIFRHTHSAVFVHEIIDDRFRPINTEMKCFCIVGKVVSRKILNIPYAYDALIHILIFRPKYIINVPHYPNKIQSNKGPANLKYTYFIECHQKTFPSHYLALLLSLSNLPYPELSIESSTHRV